MQPNRALINGTFGATLSNMLVSTKRSVSGPPPCTKKMKPVTRASTCRRQLPLPERIALGGWERYEELCVQFVAYTRARERLILLSHLDDFNRQNLLHLWDEPVPRSLEPTQEVPSNECDQSDADELDDASVQEALLVLELTALPASEAALNAAFKSVIRKAHPDRNFGSTAATARSATLLAARATIKKALHAA